MYIAKFSNFVECEVFLKVSTFFVCSIFEMMRQLSQPRCQRLVTGAPTGAVWWVPLASCGSTPWPFFLSPLPPGVCCVGHEARITHRNRDDVEGGGAGVLFPERFSRCRRWFVVCLCRVPPGARGHAHRFCVGTTTHRSHVL